MDDAVTALTRRAKLPTIPDATSSQVFRAAGVPLIAAALVAATGTVPAQAATTPKQPTTQANRSKPATQSKQATQSKPATQSKQATRAKRATPAQPAARPKAVAAAARTQPPAHVTYTVRPGDTVTDIAARAKISVESIVKANDLDERALIVPGQSLVLPGVAPRVKRTVTPKAAPVVHAVKAGDTVVGIAARYKITPASIIAANRLGPTALIHPGRKLVLPGVKPPRPPAKPTPPPTHPYTVKDGDTLHGISEGEKVGLDDILRLNHLGIDDVIHPGQTLHLPGAPKSDVPNTFLGRTYPDSVARAAAANRATLAKRDLPKRADMQAIVVKTATSLGVDPALALAIAYQESGFDQRQVSPANAIGTMQVIPSTGAWASQLVGRPLNLLDPEDNAAAGVAVLAALLAQAPEADAIAGYYQGLGSVRKNGMYDDTRRYVANVQTLKVRFGGQPAAPPAPAPAAPAANPQ